jgi:hypothetical protein
MSIFDKIWHAVESVTPAVVAIVAAPVIEPIKQGVAVAEVAVDLARGAANCNNIGGPSTCTPSWVLPEHVGPWYLLVAKEYGVDPTNPEGVLEMINSSPKVLKSIEHQLKAVQALV